MNKKRNIILAILVVVLICSSSIGTALAYFTANDEVKGVATLNIGNETEIKETVDKMEKTLSIKNTAASGTKPVFIRARAYCTSDATLTYTGTGWSNTPDYADDSKTGFYYYSSALYGQETAESLTIKITIDSTKEYEDGDEVNVAVVYESVPAVFDADGNPDLATAWKTGAVQPIGN